MGHARPLLHRDHTLLRATILLMVGVVLTVWSASYASLSWGPFIAGILALGGAGLLLVLDHDRTRPRRRSRAALALPAVIAVMVATLPIGWATDVRFAVSEGGFDRVVTAAGPALDGVTYPAACPARIGLYSIEKCGNYNGTYLYFDAALNSRGAGGFARIPPEDSYRSVIDHFYFRHLHGDWYTFSTSTDTSPLHHRIR